MYPQNSLDVSVWNTQWLLGTLIGADHLPAKGTTQRSECVPLPATIQELDEEVVYVYYVSSDALNYHVCISVLTYTIFILCAFSMWLGQ